LPAILFRPAAACPSGQIVSPTEAPEKARW
jgi:hypothetical protein